MRVLHINCNYMDSWLHQNMVEQLNGIGIDNDVFVPLHRFEGHIVAPNDYAKISICFNKMDRFFYHYKQSKIFRAVQQEYKIINYNCLHAYTVFTDGNVVRKLSEKYGIPYVVAVRNTDLNVFFKYMIHLRKTGLNVLREASAIIFLSTSYKKELFDKYIPKRFREEIAKKCYIIPNGIDEFWYENENLNINNLDDMLDRIQRKEIRFIYVGAIDKNKNVSFVAKAIYKLKLEGWDVRFDVIGKIKDNVEYKKIVSYEFVNYYPPMKKEEIIWRLRKNDIFIMVSHKESFGLVYAEALSQGLPVIYTKGQGFDEQYPNGYIGYATSDLDIEDLVGNIKKIVFNYEEIVRNIERSTMRFSWKEICNKYVNIYSDL